MNSSIFGIYHPTHKLTLLLTDLALLAIVFYLATGYRLNSIPDYLSVEYIGVNLILIGSLFIGGAYTSTSIASRPKLPLNTFFIVIAAAIPSLLFVYLLGPERFTAILGRGVFPASIVTFGILAMIGRLVINHLFSDSKKRSQIIFLGKEDAHIRLTTSLNASSLSLESKRVVNLAELDHNNLPTAIVICPDHKPSENEQHTLLELRLSGVPIFSLSDFFESFLFLVPVQDINNDWFIRTEGFTMLHSSVATRLKRGADILAALTLLCLSLPIMAISALFIALSSRGPIIFSQTRVGKEGKSFTLIKFRTMRLDAEKSGAQWASYNDSRIFPFGHFLRKTRIDELPQCWNILKGEMSFIGPRPERPEFTSTLAEKIPYYDLRHIIKPGLTGWAQVCYPYGASTEDALRKLQYDLYYIKNYSLILDLNIILRTVLVTLGLRGR